MPKPPATSNQVNYTCMIKVNIPVIVILHHHRRAQVSKVQCVYFFFLATFDVNGVFVNGRGKGGKLFLISIQ